MQHIWKTGSVNEILWNEITTYCGLYYDSVSKDVFWINVGIDLPDKVKKLRVENNMCESCILLEFQDKAENATCD